jgi:cell wall-associated NlpC family hydrolase
MDSGAFTFRSSTVTGPRPRPLRLTHVHAASSGDLAACFTHGAHSVCLRGPRRRFHEPTAAHAVTHCWWVRALPRPFDGQLDEAWLRRALQANATRAPDILALAMQYLHGAQDRWNDQGLRIAGEALYGPGPQSDREEGSDFNDFLGIEWHYGGQTDQPEQRHVGCLDCSGYMRMVWGFRAHAPTGHGLPLSPASSKGATLPRRARQMLASAPGEIVIARTPTPQRWLQVLQPGDLLFFDADCKDGAAIDHVGMLLGQDAAGRHRFVSSRKKHNGPTLGDYRGMSVIESPARLYRDSWRAARRL